MKSYNSGRYLLEVSMNVIFTILLIASIGSQSSSQLEPITWKIRYTQNPEEIMFTLQCEIEEGYSVPVTDTCKGSVEISLNGKIIEKAAIEEVRGRFGKAAECGLHYEKRFYIVFFSTPMQPRGSHIKIKYTPYRLSERLPVETFSLILK